MTMFMIFLCFKERNKLRVDNLCQFIKTLHNLRLIQHFPQKNKYIHTSWYQSSISRKSIDIQKIIEIHSNYPLPWQNGTIIHWVLRTVSPAGLLNGKQTCWDLSTNEYRQQTAQAVQVASIMTHETLWCSWHRYKILKVVPMEKLYIIQ